MQLFQNILVGVDLNRCNPLSTSTLGPIAWDAIERGISLAKIDSAKVLFFAAVNLSEEALQPLPEHDRTRMAQTIREAADNVLGQLVTRANQKGVAAAGKLVSGKGWLEIIRQVLRDRHDLVVVGTRDLTGIRRVLFGNTAMKLLRRCPCPVLVTKHGTNVSPMNVLAATDLQPAGEDAMRLAISLAGRLDARLHILHVVDYPLDRIWSTGLAGDREHEYHKRLRAEAERVLNEQLNRTNFRTLGDRVQVHLADGMGIADVAIQHFIQVNNIHLLVMGTIGRGGIPGIMIGNTAERLLPEVHCSVLAVKPPDSQCPVRLE
jgi:universal stress protein E